MYDDIKKYFKTRLSEKYQKETITNTVILICERKSCMCMCVYNTQMQLCNTTTPDCLCRGNFWEET